MRTIGFLIKTHTHTLCAAAATAAGCFYGIRRVVRACAQVVSFFTLFFVVVGFSYGKGVFFSSW